MPNRSLLAVLPYADCDQIVDDDVPEDDEIFTVRLFNPSEGFHLAKDRDIMEIVILDDDRPGRLEFEMPEMEVCSCVHVRVFVC